MMATIIFTHENGGLVHQILAQIIGTFFYHHQLPNLEWTLIFLDISHKNFEYGHILSISRHWENKSGYKQLKTL